jgi:hypothetical protein
VTVASLSAHSLRLLQARVFNEILNPSSGAGVNAPIGSLLMRNGAYPTRPTETYLKLGATDKAWTKQNLININLFNVKTFGATGDGVTDDTTAIIAAYTAAIANGGGEVYFPATPNFYSITRQAGRTGIIVLSNVHNITTTGDGNASKIRQTGSCAGFSTYMWQVSNGSTGIYFRDIYLDNFAITNPDPTQENHGIQFLGQSTDSQIGPSECDITRCFFGVFVGDAVRFLGEVSGIGHIVTDVRIRRSYFGCGNSRVAVSAERCNHAVQIVSNYLPTDQPVHFEPTGGTVAGGAGPEEWSIVGNHMAPRPGGSLCAIALSGAGDNNLATRNRFSFNTVNLGAISGPAIQQLSMVGNVVIYNLPDGTPPSSSQSPILFLQQFERGVIAANVIVNLFQANQGAALKLEFDNGDSPDDNVVTGNVIRMLCNGATSAFGMSDTDHTEISNNLCSIDSNATGGAGIFINAAVTNLSDAHMIGNMVLATGSDLAAALDFNVQSASAPPPSFVANAAAYGNYVSGPMTNALRINKGGATQIAFPASGIHNFGVGFSGQFFSTTGQMAQDGNSAGFGAQSAFYAVAGLPNGIATGAQGSFALNIVGGDGTVMSYKEGGGANTNTGWIGVGGDDVPMGALSVGAATTALFFAPGGMGLVIASAVEIQWTVPRPGRIRNLRGKFVAGVGGGNNTFTVRKNGADQTLSFTILNTATAGSDTTHSFAVVAGDLISISIIKDAAPGTPQTFAQLVVEFI